MRIKCLFLAALMLAVGSPGLAQSTTNRVAPNVVVKNLYAVQKAGAGPFFQTKNRALVDKYFTKDFADLIWRDATTAKGEVGAFDFDPLYHAQDMKITAFKIGAPMYGEGNSAIADVVVNFKNMGKDERIMFRVELVGGKDWRISNIYYLGDRNDNSESLKEILSGAAGAAKTTSGIRKVDFKNFDYGALCAGAHKFLAFDSGEKLVLSKGHQSQGDEMNYADLGSVRYVDFDGDGKEEAFVVINGQTAGSSNRYLATYVFAYQNGSARQIWSRCEEGSVAVLKGRSILFTRPDWVGDDAHCCFSYIATDTYGWKGSKIALISTRRKKSGGR
jgi:hypothetical protein